MFHSRLTFLILATMSVVLVNAAAARQPELEVAIEKQEIYEGESVLYRVTINGVENPEPPKLTGFDDFQVSHLGAQSLNSQQIAIINGRRSVNVRFGRQFDFRLTPLRNGSLTIPAPTATVDGTALKGRELTLRVIAPDDQDTAILRLTVDRQTVYPMQPFDVTLLVAVKELPGDLAERDPLSVQPKPPALNIPWLDDDRLPEAIKPESSWQEILEPLMSRSGDGFQINNVGNSSVFSLFEREATAFHPKPARVIRKDRNGIETGYWEYRFQRTLIPHSLGNFTFGPVTLKGTFANAVKDGQLVGDRLFAVAKSISLTVQDVPLEGRPDSYIGAVGTFDIDSTLAPTTAKVGDPMTLILDLSGRGTLADAQAPQIASLPGVDGSFRTYDGTEESRGNSRRFTFSLRPLNSNVTEFPAIPVSWFDVDQERYITVSTKPIPVRISEAESLADSEIISAPTANSGQGTDLETSAGGIFANDSNLGSLRNESVNAGRWITFWTGMIGIWAVSTFLVGAVRKRNEDPAAVRRRGSPARALAAINNATVKNSSDHGSVCEGLAMAVTGLIADFANVTEAGLAPRDAAEHLQDLGASEELCDRLLTFLTQCDAARYGSVSDGIDPLESQARSLIDDLANVLKKKRNS